MITADVYGAGEADAMLGTGACGGARARRVCVIGAVGHDFYEGDRDGPRASRVSPIRACASRRVRRLPADGDRAQPRALRGRALRPAPAPQPGPHRLPQRSGVGRDGGAARRGLARRLGVAPGPANGFTLDLIDCFERFGERIDWAMIILGPLEPWPGELCLHAAAQPGRE